VRTLFSRCVPASGGAAGYILTRRPGIGSEITLPNNTDIAVTSGTPFGTFGAWTLVQAAQAFDVWIDNFYAFRQGVGKAIGDALIEWSYGAANTPLNAHRYNEIILDPAGDDAGRYGMMSNTYHTLLPAGNALYARVSEASAAATWRVLAVGWTAVPAFTPLDVASATGAGRYYPTNVAAGATALNVPSAVAPAFGAWTTVVDPAPNDMLVEHVMQAASAGGATGSFWIYQLGIGAAGAELDVGTFPTGNSEMLHNCVPPVWVKAGERLAVRAAFLAVSARRTIIKVVDL